MQKGISARVLLGVLLALGLAGAAWGQGVLIPEERAPAPVPIEPLRIKAYTVDVTIKDATAVTAVNEVFANDTDRRLEGTFLFPLPEDAAISNFQMEIDGKMTAGDLVDRQVAQNIYNDIVRKMRDPAILEYSGRNLFKVRIFPIEPKSEKRIRLQYSEALKLDGKIVKYVHPMNVEKMTKQAIETVSLNANIESTMGIKSVYSPSHEIDEFRDGDNKCKVGFEVANVVPVRDFILFYTLSNEDFGLHVLTHRVAGEDGYFMLMVAPKQTFTEEEILNKNVVFVLDVSGSMQYDDKIGQAKQALKYCLESLKQGDKFNIVTFSTGVDSFAEGLQTADSPTVAKAKEFVDKVVARGGTFIEGALQKALESVKDVQGATLIVFLTDGRPTVGEDNIGKLVEMVNKLNGYNPDDPKTSPRSRIFTFGVGDDVNTHLLDQVAKYSQGYSQYVRPKEDVEVSVSSFYEKVSHPVLADIRVDFGKIHVYDYYPRELPDLFKGSELRIFGRYRNDGDVALKLMGKVDGKEREVTADATFPDKREDNAFIPQLWAIRRVAHLMDEIRLRGENKELKDEVIALGKQWGIVTPYTSYIVLEGAERKRLTNVMIEDVRREADRLATPGRPGGYGGYGGGGGAYARVGRPGTVLEESAGGFYAQSEVRGPAGPAGAPGAPGPQGPPAKAAGEAIREEFAYDTALRGAVGRREVQYGSRAVDIAAQLNAIRNQEVQQIVANVRSIGRRTFYNVQNIWVQADLNEQTRLTRVRYMSDAYFQLAARPEIAQCLAQGQNVIVILAANNAIEIADDENARSNPFTEAELAQLFPAEGK